MTPQELKISIFQKAIQGKLVDQRPEEGTGKELFQQIQTRKKHLIKTGKLKKEKPLSEITEDEIPFDIPESWCWGHLDDVVVKPIKRGKSPTYAAKSNTLVFAQKCNTKAGYIDLTLALCLDESKLSKYPDEEFMRDSDIVINSTGNGTLGRVGIYHDSDNPANSPLVPDSHVTVIRVSETVSVEYTYYVLKYYQPFMEKLGTGSTNQTELSASVVRALLFPIPPLAEQKRIVAKIEELLPLIDRYEQAWSRLEDFNKRFPVDMQKSILQMAVQGKLVDQRPEEGTGEELYQQIQAEKQRLIKSGELRKTKALPKITAEYIPTDFPESWKVCYMDDIAFVTKLAGFEYTKNVAPNLVSNGIPLFKGKNVQNGKLVLKFESYIPETVSDELPRSQILKKCLLTPYVGTIGNIAIFDGSFKAHLGSNVGKIELLNGLQEYVMEEYVLYYLRSTIGYDELTKYKKATAQESISIDAIRNVIIALPPLAEQKRIVAKLEEILPLCDRLK